LFQYCLKFFLGNTESEIWNAVPFKTVAFQMAKK
jgi:hypothetical protein